MDVSHQRRHGGEFGIIRGKRFHNQGKLLLNLSDYIGEATAYDKKLMLERKDPTSWLKSVSAFANTQGGRLLFGVANDGSLVGLAMRRATPS